jgi:hypothetical protein
MGHQQSVAANMRSSDGYLQFLLKLNSKLSAAEGAGETIRSAGIPDYIKERASLISTDSIKA